MKRDPLEPNLNPWAPTRPGDPETAWLDRRLASVAPRSIAWAPTRPAEAWPTTRPMVVDGWPLDDSDDVALDGTSPDDFDDVALFDAPPASPVEEWLERVERVALIVACATGALALVSAGALVAFVRSAA